MTERIYLKATLNLLWVSRVFWVKIDNVFSYTENGDREATSTPFSVVLDQSHKKEKENQKSQEQNRQSPRYNPYNNSGVNLFEETM